MIPVQRLRPRLLHNTLHFPIQFPKYSSLNSPPQSGIVAKGPATASWSLKLPPVTPNEILKELWPLIWPRKDWKSRVKVCAAVSLLLGGKVCTIHY